MAKKQQYIPRGIRNNNPLNIRIGNVWLGEVQNPTDPNFEQFVSMEYGIRAACVLIRRYIRHYHRTTIPSILAAWAPSSENNTVTYVDTVCQLSHLSPMHELRYEDKASICSLIAAMVQVECGQPINSKTIEKGYDLA